MSLLSVALNPTAGEPGGQEPNWQPSEPTVSGSSSEEPVPDWFSAGEERTVENPAPFNVFTSVLTFCSAQPSSFDTTTLKALARSAGARTRRAVQRILGEVGVVSNNPTVAHPNENICAPDVSRNRQVIEKSMGYSLSRDSSC